MKLKSTPEYGTLRTRKVFLWLPRKFFIYEKRGSITKCWGQTETLWLEAVELDEEWIPISREQASYWQMNDYRRTR